MNVKFSHQAQKELKRMDSETKQRIKYAIINLPAGDVKKLKGVSDGSLRLRVGAYRIIHRYDGDSLIIELIGLRGDIYKEM